MTRPILAYKADPTRGRVWAEVFAAEAPEIEFLQWAQVTRPEQVRYLATWQPPTDICQRLPRLELLFSSGAGVDQFDLNALPPTLPVVRMIEPGIVHGMVEYVTHAVLDLHRDMPAYRRAQSERLWQALQVKPAAQRRVGVLGLGQLGRAVLDRLLSFGFVCSGWSRSRHALEAIHCYAGAEELDAFLAQCDILVCLLPLTEATKRFLDAGLFGRLPHGASLIHVGRGPQLVAEDLLAALASGQMAEAVLDVTDPEPLPAEHPFWTHPQVRLTPHIASMTQPETAALAVIDNIRRHRQGLPLIGLVDRRKGY